MTLETLEAVPAEDRVRVLLPADTLVRELPAVALDSDQARRLGLGQRVSGLAGAAGLVRVYGPAGTFLGVCDLSADGVLAPRRLLATG
jgi:tRNA pseudouridine55 synthase